MKKSTIFSWNVKQLSEALHLSETDVKLYFCDGRKVSFIYERRLVNEVIGGKLAPSEGAGYDLIDKSGNKWEVRSVTENIYFCPSYMVGSGRKFNEKGFLEKLDDIAGYVILDIKSFPNVPFWIIDKKLVLNWWQNKRLGTTTLISKRKFLDLINELD